MVIRCMHYSVGALVAFGSNDGLCFCVLEVCLGVTGVVKKQMSNVQEGVSDFYIEFL